MKSNAFNCKTLFLPLICLFLFGTSNADKSALSEIQFKLLITITHVIENHTFNGKDDFDFHLLNGNQNCSTETSKMKKWETLSDLAVKSIISPPTSNPVMLISLFVIPFLWWLIIFYYQKVDGNGRRGSNKMTKYDIGDDDHSMRDWLSSRNELIHRNDTSNWNDIGLLRKIGDLVSSLVKLDNAEYFYSLSICFNQL